MPATNLEIITYSFQKIGVIDEIQAPSAEQGQTALTILNNYLLNEAADGMRLGWYTQSNLAANAPLQDSDIHGVKLLLAKQLASHFGITITDPILLGEIDEAKRQLVKRSLRYAEADFSELSRPQGGPWGGPNWI